MNEAERYWASYFHDICPYTGKKCEDWNCSECEVEKTEREFNEYGDILDLLHRETEERIKEYLENENKRLFNEMIEKKQIEKAVIICNRKNKFILKGAFPNLCILGIDYCDEKIYMVTDKTIAENIRECLKWENKQ